MPRFDAVFFDIGSTLIPSARLINDVAHATCRRLARAGLIPKAQSFFLNYLQADAQIDPPHLSHIYADQRLVAQAERLSGLPGDTRRQCAFLAIYRALLRARIQPSHTYKRLFAALKKAGIQRGIISDGSIEGQGEVLARLGLLPLISPGLLFISEAEGVTKENPEIYRRALAAANVAAARALMIGDRLDRDVAVPQSTGMKAALLRQHARPAFIPAGLPLKHVSTRPEKVFQNWNELEKWLRKIMRE